MRAFLLLLLVPLITAQNNCTAYCANMTMYCMGANAQFPVPDTNNFCSVSCAAYPTDTTTPPVTSGDSYQCRQYHLSVASISNVSAVTHCPHAGFDGGPGTCGTACDAYCDITQSVCNGSNTVYTSYTNCMTECAFFPNDPTWNVSSPQTPIPVSIDSWQCRAWHSQFAAGNNAPNPHCIHASPTGADGICGTQCENYCDTVFASCTGSLLQWANHSQCLLGCAAYSKTPAGTPTNVTTSGNNLPCRKYHAVVANGSSTLAMTHCVHTGPLSGSGVCGTECEGYCTLLGQACAANVATCMANCTSYPSTPVPTADILMWKPKSDTLECRAAYAIAALGNPTYCVGAMGMDSDRGLCGSGVAAIQAQWGLIVLLALALSLMQ